MGTKSIRFTAMEIIIPQKIFPLKKPKTGKYLSRSKRSRKRESTGGMSTQQAKRTLSSLFLYPDIFIANFRHKFVMLIFEFCNDFSINQLHSITYTRQDRKYPLQSSPVSSFLLIYISKWAANFPPPSPVPHWGGEWFCYLVCLAWLGSLPTSTAKPSSCFLFSPRIS